jgi:hypothetical protein
MRQSDFIDTTTTPVVGTTVAVVVLVVATSIYNTADPCGFFGCVHLIGGQASVQYPLPIADRDHITTQGWAMLPL